jgi:hypothetical protein
VGAFCVGRYVLARLVRGVQAAAHKTPELAELKPPRGVSERDPRTNWPQSKEARPVSHALTSDSYNIWTPRLLVWS